MNIAQAKAELSNAMKAYFAKDEFGNFRIPPEAQRPVFLMGPPGIGKTAVVRQAAEELGIGLVSYSITHHTRQSALGLPMIVRRDYGGREYHVSEYTMSEIIASVYDVIAETGAKEGILFLDEINCTSETLTPVMLQFLQFKTFGRHRLPDGWIVVTAGNPPEYNRSARDFDIVTWDRLKRIDIEPDYAAWKPYAQKHGVHGSILSYLDIRKNYFYRTETTVDGMNFATARGWVDLSDMILLYEENDIPVTEDLVGQYIQDTEISEDFAAYYDLYSKYRSDYRIEDILSGTEAPDILRRASDADFDERLSLMSLLLSSIGTDFRRVIGQEDVITELLPILRDVKQGASLKEKLEEEQHRMEQTEKRGIMTPQCRLRFERTLSFLSKLPDDGNFEPVKKSYDALLSDMRADAGVCSSRLSSLFGFVRRAFGEGDELLVLVTELTADWYAARFISRYGSDEYYACSSQLSFHERQLEMIEQCVSYYSSI